MGAFAGSDFIERLIDRPGFLIGLFGDKRIEYFPDAYNAPVKRDLLFFVGVAAVILFFMVCAGDGFRFLKEFRGASG